MKLNYYLLWVEDDDSWYETTSELFKDTIEELGFKPIFKRNKSFDEVTDELGQNGLQKYDILLIDYNLRNSSNGDTIIDFIRNKEIYTDVIFYSSDKHLILEAIKEHVFEGVYHSDRKELETKFEKIFKTTIKKIEEINSMRGLVVGETSELDSLIEECLHKYLNNHFISNFNISKFVEEQIIKKQKGRMEFLISQYNENGFKGVIPYCDAIKKWELLRAIIKANKTEHESLDIFLKTNSTYQDEVIEIRNKFAHAKVIINEDGKEVLKALIGENHFEFNDQNFKEIRNNLIKHRESLHGLFGV